MAGITTEGFEPKALSDIQAEISAALLAGISPTLDLSDSTLDGQKIGSESSQLRQVWEALQAIYAGMDIDQAEGDQLTAACKMVGVFRRAATYSSVEMTITLAAGTYAANSLIVYPSGSPEDRFSNDEEIVTAGGTLTGQLFSAELEGPVRANEGALTQIADPVAGFSAPNNPAAATLGLEEESDAALYERWQLSKASTGSTNVDAIKSDIDAVDGVTSSRVLANEGDTTDANGIPAGCLAVLALGGTDAAVAQQIWRSKAAGEKTYGSTTETVVDTQGNEHEINFTRPSQVRVYVEVDATCYTGLYPAAEDATGEGEDITNAVWNSYTRWRGLPDNAESDTWGIGEDVIVRQILGAIMRVQGLHDVTGLRVDTVTPAVATGNLTVAFDEYADIDLADITVNVTFINGAP